MSEYQDFFNVFIGGLLSVCGFLTVWMIASIRDLAKDAHKRIDVVADEVSKNAKEVAEKFVRTEEYRETIKGLRFDLNDARKDIKDDLRAVQTRLDDVLKTLERK